MKGLTIQASKRNILGKKTRFLRRQGITPAHLFGHGVESLTLECDSTNLWHIIAKAGTTRLISLEIEGDKQPRSVFIREIQRDACTRALIHVDFFQVRMKEKIKAEVPIALVGEAPALKEKGRLLTHGITRLNIECLPDKIPPVVEVDLSLLEEIEQAIFVKDITFSSDITLITDPEQMVVKVTETRVERVEEIEEAVAAVEGAEAEAEAPTEEKTEEAAG